MDDERQHDDLKCWSAVLGGLQISMLTDWIASANTGNVEAKREIRASFVYAEAEVAEV